MQHVHAAVQKGREWRGKPNTDPNNNISNQRHNKFSRAHSKRELSVSCRMQRGKLQCGCAALKGTREGGGGRASRARVARAADKTCDNQLWRATRRKKKNPIDSEYKGAGVATRQYLNGDVCALSLSLPVSLPLSLSLSCFHSWSDEMRCDALCCWPGLVRRVRSDFS